MGKETFRQLSPFVYGDPRFLAGGSKISEISYNNDVKLNTEAVKVPAVPEKSLYDTMQGLGQMVSVGKCGYHGQGCANLFVTKEDLIMPTVGVEIETIMRTCDSEHAQMFRSSIYSNWFHAESDGSLDNCHHGTYGYELVTTVLPARLYRDINVWTGFQNLVSPLLYSYDSLETGLHVHVGMDWFENTKLPAMCSNSLILVGKMLTARLYYSFLPRSLAQRVFLRNSDGRYCHESSISDMTTPLKSSSGNQIMDDILDSVISTTDENYFVLPLMRLVGQYQTNCESDVVDLTDTYQPSYYQGSSALNYGHDTEVNSSPSKTIEFRRGKGTINALSIHRIIELCMLMVTYAGHVIDNPSEMVSSRKLMEYIIENTTSNALKSLTEKELVKCV